MNLIVLPSVDSTNNYLQSLLSQDLVSEGTMVIALEQTAGRGQRGNDWESLAGAGLYASVLLQPPSWTVEKQFDLNKAIACAVARYIEAPLGREVKIKWPNDILIDNQKVAGILVENILRGHRVSAVIAGIGINLNQTSFSHPFETPATSLRMETGRTYDPESEAPELFREIWADYKNLQSGETVLLHEHYRHRLYKRGETALFKTDEHIFSGTLIDVNHEGAALVEADGAILRLRHPQSRFHTGN
ncbi:MAG: biotin--[acetyl-CoA-carboxylase] ligase [Bacteroidia bacterium]|nr:biotin--[acetyl-CoA-carboxylase] ligase [Bacteroidia bacterium]